MFGTWTMIREVELTNNFNQLFEFPNITSKQLTQTWTFAQWSASNI